MAKSLSRVRAPVTAHAQTLPNGPRAPGRSFVKTSLYTCFFAHAHKVKGGADYFFNPFKMQ